MNEVTTVDCENAARYDVTVGGGTRHVKVSGVGLYGSGRKPHGGLK